MPTIVVGIEGSFFKDCLKSRFKEKRLLEVFSTSKIQYAVDPRTSPVLRPKNPVFFQYFTIAYKKVLKH